MPTYLYTAKSLKGEEKKGSMEASDLQDLSQKLRQQKFILIRAKQEDEKKTSGISLPFGKVPLAEKMFFVKNLRVMTVAGLPLPRAIGSLAEQTKSEKFRKALLNIREEISKGRTLSSALGDYPGIFSELFQSMVKVGEESGTLDKVLESLSLQLEKEHELKSKVIGALIYPSVIVVAMLGVGTLMLVTVIPRLAATFIELGIELPATTKIVIGLADFLINRWYLALIGIFLTIMFFSQAVKNENFKKNLDMLFLKIPVMSGIVRSTNSASMLRTLSSLISAGTSLPRALEITAGVLGNFHFKESMIVASEKVRRGEKLSEVIEKYKGVYPTTVIQMITVGEETGETSTILSKLADFFEEEVSDTTKNLTSVIEPVLMLIIGAAIGFFAVSMIQPMYTMLGSIE